MRAPLRAPLRAATQAALAWALATSPSHANDQIPAPPQRVPLLITGATLHPVSAPPIPQGQMLVVDGRIVALGGPTAVLPLPSGPLQRVDYSGRHLYPGFIAANTALGLTEISAVRATVDHREAGALNPHAHAHTALHADSELIPVTRSNGVLTALAVPGGGASLISGHSALMQLDGWTTEELTLQPDLALHLRLPSLRFERGGFQALGPKEQQALRERTQQQLQQLDEALAEAAAYQRARQADPQAPQDPRWEAMRPVMRGERPVFIHADEIAQIRHALALAERHRLRWVLVGGADAWRVAPLLRAQRVPVILTGVNRLPLRRDEDIDVTARLPALLQQAGVAFAIARDGGTFSAAHERNLPYEAAAAMAHGLPPEEALKAVTLYPAQILGVADRLGSLQPGRLATFFISDGDPLQTRTRIEALYVQGRPVDAENRQTELTRKYEERLRQIGAGTAAGPAAHTAPAAPNAPLAPPAPTAPTASTAPVPPAPPTPRP